ASIEGSTFFSHCATSVPSVRRDTDGTSAQLTNQSAPDATVCARDHPAAVRSANLSVVVPVLPVSSQLTTSPPGCRVICGAIEPAAAPTVAGAMVTAHGAGGAAGEAGGAEVGVDEPHAAAESTTAKRATSLNIVAAYTLELFMRTTLTAGVVLAAACAAVLGAQAPAAPAGEPRIWQGIFTAAQAARGKETFTTACLRCHGGDLTGVTGPALTGDRFYQSWGGEPVDRLFLKIRDTMPPNFGTVLDDKANLDVVTYILQTNGFPAGTGEQAAVQNFSLVQTVGCLVKGDGSSWMLARTAEPLSTREDAPSPQALQSAAARPLGTRIFRLLSVVPFSPASHVGEKMEARGLVYIDPADSKITLTSLKPTGATCD